jgi:hypothetical protein
MGMVRVEVVDRVQVTEMYVVKRLGCLRRQEENDVGEAW